MKDYKFLVRRKAGGPYETLTIRAASGADAVRQLPPTHVWDFCVSTPVAAQEEIRDARMEGG